MAAAPWEARHPSGRFSFAKAVQLARTGCVAKHSSHISNQMDCSVWSISILMGRGWKVWALPISTLFLECLCVSESPSQTPLLHLLPWAEEQCLIKADHFLLNGKQALEAVTSVSTQVAKDFGILITFMLDENFGCDSIDSLAIANEWFSRFL